MLRESLAEIFARSHEITAFGVLGLGRLSLNLVPEIVLFLIVAIIGVLPNIRDQTEGQVIIVRLQELSATLPISRRFKP